MKLLDVWAEDDGRYCWVEVDPEIESIQNPVGEFVEVTDERAEFLNYLDEINQEVQEYWMESFDPE